MTSAPEQRSRPKWLTDDSFADEAIGDLLQAGCESAELLELLENFRSALVFETVRKLVKADIKTQTLAWGLSASKLRRLPNRLESLAEDLDPVRSSPAMQAFPLILRIEGAPWGDHASTLERSVKWAPGALRWFAAAVRLQRAILKGGWGRRAFNLVHDQERLLLKYVEERTGTPRYAEVETVLDAAERTLNPKTKRAGEKALQLRYLRMRHPPVSIKTALHWANLPLILSS